MSSNYVGQELDTFAHARNWKKYWSRAIEPYLAGDILEVGAGFGANTEFLLSDRITSWVGLEPDPELAARMRTLLAVRPEFSKCVAEVGTTATIDPDRKFDGILYIDVLEHIEGDSAELARAATLLKRGGKIIVLAPAHQWLYTPFDRAIGHFRRYDRASLSACKPPACKLREIRYLDSAGVLASTGNRLFLQQPEPDLRQILFWDRFLVPISRVLDPLTFHAVGKSVLAIWERE
jgi:SAM-dependent methyltransferase